MARSGSTSRRGIFRRGWIAPRRRRFIGTSAAVAATVVSPDAVAIPSAIPAPALLIEVTPAAIAIPAATTSPALTIEAAPAATAIPAVVPPPSTAGDTAPAPQPIPGSVPAPGLAIVVNPSAVAIPASVPAPSASGDAAPSPQPIPGAVPAPGLEIVVNPVPVAVLAVVPPPSATDEAAPPPVPIPGSVPAPGLEIDVNPAPVGPPVGVGNSLRAPMPSLTIIVNPDPATIPSNVPPVDASTAHTVSPASLPIPAVVPTVALTLIVNPAPIEIPAVLPPPVVTGGAVVVEEDVGAEIHVSRGRYRIPLPWRPRPLVRQARPLLLEARACAVGRAQARMIIPRALRADAGAGAYAIVTTLLRELFSAEAGVGVSGDAALRLHDATEDRLVVHGARARALLRPSIEAEVRAIVDVAGAAATMTDPEDEELALLGLPSDDGLVGLPR